MPGTHCRPSWGLRSAQRARNRRVAGRLAGIAPRSGPARPCSVICTRTGRCPLALGAASIRAVAAPFAAAVAPFPATSRIAVAPDREAGAAAAALLVAAGEGALPLPWRQAGAPGLTAIDQAVTAPVVEVAADIAAGLAPGVRGAADLRRSAGPAPRPPRRARSGASRMRPGGQADRTSHRRWTHYFVLHRYAAGASSDPRSRRPCSRTSQNRSCRRGQAGRRGSRAGTTSRWRGTVSGTSSRPRSARLDGGSAPGSGRRSRGGPGCNRRGTPPGPPHARGHSRLGKGPRRPGTARWSGSGAGRRPCRWRTACRRCAGSGAGRPRRAGHRPSGGCPNRDRRRPPRVPQAVHGEMRPARSAAPVRRIADCPRRASFASSARSRRSDAPSVNWRQPGSVRGVSGWAPAAGDQVAAAS